MNSTYSINVFINCPFDESYHPIFDAIVFTVIDCGYIAHSALEIDDSSVVRIEKIAEIISSCQYGIHDISRTEIDKNTQLPRFNMPLELGMFLGAKRFGGKEQKKKVCLILDKTSYRYQKFISDVAGQDIRSHENEVSNAVNVVRNWLRSTSGTPQIPGGKEIYRRYLLFRSELPTLCKNIKLTIEEMIFNDYSTIVSEWLKQNPL